MHTTLTPHSRSYGRGEYSVARVTTHILMFTRPHTRRRSQLHDFLLKLNEAQDSSRGRSGHDCPRPGFSRSSFKEYIVCVDGRVSGFVCLEA